VIDEVDLEQPALGVEPAHAVHAVERSRIGGELHAALADGRKHDIPRPRMREEETEGVIEAGAGQSPVPSALRVRDRSELFSAQRDPPHAGRDIRHGHDVELAQHDRKDRRRAGVSGHGGSSRGELMASGQNRRGERYELRVA
jgi:hypothetical protein